MPTGQAKTASSSKKSASKKTSAKKSATTKSAGNKKASDSKYGTAASASVGREMHEFKEGKLKSGSGRKVTNPKQAIAIGLSEARKSGAKVPAAKKSGKTSSKKSSSK